MGVASPPCREISQICWLAFESGSSAGPGFFSGASRSFRLSVSMREKGNSLSLAKGFSRSDRKARDSPSGDHRGEESEPDPPTNRRVLLLPSVGTNQICAL